MTQKIISSARTFVRIIIHLKANIAECIQHHNSGGLKQLFMIAKVMMLMLLMMTTTMKMKVVVMTMEVSGHLNPDAVVGIVMVMMQMLMLLMMTTMTMMVPIRMTMGVSGYLNPDAMVGIVVAFSSQTHLKLALHFQDHQDGNHIYCPALSQSPRWQSYI